MKKKKGFTLVELLVVIAILAILATVSVVGYMGFTKKAQVSNDTSLVAQLNTLLKADEAINGKAKTPTDALKVTEESGYNVEKLTPTTDKYDIVWNQEENQFALLDEQDGVVYGTLSEKEYMNWKFVDSYVDGTKFSIYLKGSELSGSLEDVKTGLDVGNNKNITSITYNTKDLTSQKEVVLRTASYNTKLDINAYVNGDNGDSIKHYGNCGTLKISSLAKNSYHEIGNTAYLPFNNSGRVVIENGGTIKMTYVSSTDAILENNGGTLESVYAENEEIKNQLSQDNIVVEDELLTETDAETKAKDIIEASFNEEVIDENELYVARIGTKGYASFEECNNNAKEGDTIILLKDININSNVVLNNKIAGINGFKNASATNNKEKYYTINVLENSSLQMNTKPSNAIIINANIVDKNADGKIILKNSTTNHNNKIDISINGDFEGEISSNFNYVIFNGNVITNTITYTNYFYGTVIVKSSSVKAGEYHSFVSSENNAMLNSTEGGSYIDINDLKIKDLKKGTFKNCNITTDNVGNGVTSGTNPTFTNCQITVNNNISYGTFNNCSITAKTILKGTFTNNKNIIVGNIVSGTFDDASFKNLELNKNIDSTSNYISLNGKTYVFDKNNIAVDATTSTPKGITTISSLNTALKTGKKVVLLKDITLTSSIVPSYSFKGTIDLDLNGKTLTLESDLFNTQANNFTIKISNGTIKESENSVIKNALIPLQNNGIKLTLENTNIIGNENTYFAIANNGSKNGNNITLKNCNISGTQYGIYSPASSSTITIENSIIEGTKTGIELRQGTLSITGNSTIKGGTTNSCEVTPNDGGTTTTNAALAVAPYNDNQIVVNYDESVKFIATKDISISNPNGVSSPNVVVNGVAYQF